MGNGGNINIFSDRISLQNSSEISATAGGEGNGGNITINAETFTALDDSRVTANAVRGNGGNITIDTTGYFVSDDFVVSASSEFGLDGTVTINTDEEDLSDVFILPEYPLVSLEEVLANSCLTARGRDRNRVRINSFGKGLPISPYSGIDEGEDLEDYTTVNLYSSEDWKPGKPLIQVEKIIVTPDGRQLGVAEVQIPKSCLE